MTRKMCFFKNHVENKAGRLAAELSMFFKRAIHEVKASGMQLSSNIYQYTPTLDYNALDY